MKRKRTKNRKKQAQGFVFPVPLALFLVLVTVTSMTYLWMHGRCEAAGLRIQRLEREKALSHQRLLDEEMKWSQLKTLPNVRAAVQRHGLNMDWAPTHRIVRLTRPSMETVPVYQELAQWTGGLHE